MVPAQNICINFQEATQTGLGASCAEGQPAHRVMQEQFNGDFPNRKHVQIIKSGSLVFNLLDVLKIRFKQSIV